MDLVKKLLIVDDDSFILELLSERLKQFYTITTCESGEEAIKLAQKHDFNIILLDYNMPELTGLDVLKEIRKFNTYSQVIIITAYPTYELAVQFNPYDVYEFISKPFQLDALIHTVNKAWDKYYLVKIKNKFKTDLIGHNTELRKVNEELQKSNQKLDEALVQYEFNILFQKRLMELADIFEHMGKVRSNSKLQAYIAKSVSHILRADRSTLYLVDEEAGELYSCFAENCNQDIRMKIGQGIAGSVAKNKQTIRVENAYEDDRFDSRLDELTTYVTKSVICMPLSDISGNVIGVLESLNKLSGSFTEDDEKVMKAFNSLASMTIQTIGLTIENEKLRAALGK